MKALLRKRFRTRRREFARAEGPGVLPALNTNLRRLIGDLDGPGRAQVCAYRPLAEEATVDVDPSWFVPRIAGDVLEFRRPDPAARLAPNRFGIAEPSPDESIPLVLNLPTLVVCPAVAVDWRGGRLGMGKSFYDRYFTLHPGCVRIGVVFHVQVSKDPLPAEQWDQPLDWIVTEKMILRILKRSSQQWT